MSTTLNILITGVGGQGVLLASELLAHAALLEQLDVKKSEVHGMAQRGGSVVSHIRFGKRVFSPLISLSQADFILAFEQLEGLRGLPFLSRQGTLIYNSYSLIPLSCTSQNLPSPDVPRLLELNKVKSIAVDAFSIAQELGNPRTQNVILVGVLSASLPFSLSTWQQAIKNTVKPRLQQLNALAFEKGRELTHA